ncbi:hypothetical protein O181_083317 [Austropuccinia psidii MF-1]|uniref:Uncharacterized protein n=1 Tax=Austropuccinia psidii MF-1 TaxID=1389203 RepID=A0A9Q3FU70_9BASI|nr:hypothetical protein [Austropuccinia psidii MF-1]
MSSFCQHQRLMVKNHRDGPEKHQDKNEMVFEMDHATYIMILSHFKIRQPHLCNHSHIPHPEDAEVLLNYAKEVSSLHKEECLISKNKPNNMIQYINHNQIWFGNVLHILKVMNEETEDMLLLVKHLKLAKSEWGEEQWLESVFERLSVVHLNQTGCFKIVPSSLVLGTCAFRKVPAWTLGCKDPSIFVQVIKKLSTQSH